jgi:hypothetical protein
LLSIFGAPHKQKIKKIKKQEIKKIEKYWKKIKIYISIRKVYQNASKLPKTG